MKNEYSYRKLSSALIADLQPRARDVVSRRFGLESNSPETLEAIGRTHSITRERVRQIIEDSLQSVREGVKEKKEKGTVAKIFQNFGDTIKRMGGMKREDLLMEELGVLQDATHAVFLLTLGDQFHKQKETEHFYAFWTTDSNVFNEISGIMNSVFSYFEKKGEPLTIEEIKDVHPSFLEVSKRIAQGYDGRWGLKLWPEVNPRGIRDKAYMVLKQTENPLHFTQVAESITELQTMLPGDAGKSVLPQTVHNELIKDDRFVLVGRGMYALAEWGYQPGTVKDILSHILEHNGKSMDKEEIIQRALEQRQVKESTILLNLQDKDHFSRDQSGKYYII